MEKFATKKLTIDLSLGDLKEVFLIGLQDTKRFKLIEETQEVEKHRLLLKTFGHPKSHGEFITAEFYEIDSSHTGLLIKSELSTDLHEIDWDVNLKNIDEIIALVKKVYSRKQDNYIEVSNTETNGTVIDSPIDVIEMTLLRNLKDKKKYKILAVSERNNVYKIRIKKYGRFATYGEIITVLLTPKTEDQTYVDINSENLVNSQSGGLFKNEININQIFSMCSDKPIVIERRPVVRKPERQEENKINEDSAFIKEFKNQLQKQEVASKTSFAKNIPCIYCGGHEKLDKETSGYLSVYADRIEFTVFLKKFEIAIKSIINNEIMTHEQITQRITATRMVLLGVFALAAPQKNKHTSNYITIEFVDHGVNSTIIFKGDDGGFTPSKNQIIKINSAILKARKAN